MLQIDHAKLAVAIFILATSFTGLLHAQEAGNSEPEASGSEKTTEGTDEALVDAEEATDQTDEAAVDAEETTVETDEALVESEEATDETDEPAVDSEETTVDTDEAVVDTEEAADQTEEPARKSPEYKKQGPALPEGMTLEETLERAAQPPPDDFPQVVADDKIFAFLLGEKLEYRFDGTDTPDVIGWELQGWLGGDFNKLWIKQEGEAVYESPATIESETDLLYARLITPFWNAQIGVQYANEWVTSTGDYEDRWSGALALQGMTPGSFEVDLSLYLSQEAHLTIALEAEYDIRITQRLVLQPLTALGFSIQDIPERGIGAGMIDAKVDLRLRYEIVREFAPYIGGRWHQLVGETADIAQAAGQDPSRWFLIAGIRFALL